VAGTAFILVGIGMAIMKRLVKPHGHPGEGDTGGVYMTFPAGKRPGGFLFDLHLFMTPHAVGMENIPDFIAGGIPASNEFP